jgi:hypothetical protein
MITSDNRARGGLGGLGGLGGYLVLCQGKWLGQLADQAEHEWWTTPILDGDEGTAGRETGGHYGALMSVESMVN